MSGRSSNRLNMRLRTSTSGCFNASRTSSGLLKSSVVAHGDIAGCDFFLTKTIEATTNPIAKQTMKAMTRDFQCIDKLLGNLTADDTDKIRIFIRVIRG